MTLQEIYYIVAAPACLVSVLITVAVFIRNKPDKVKAAVTSAIEPLLERVGELEDQYASQAKQLNEQDRKLANIGTELAHQPTRKDIDELKNRITDMLRGTADVAATQRSLERQVDRLQTFLMEDKRRE